MSVDTNTPVTPTVTTEPVAPAPPDPAATDKPVISMPHGDPAAAPVAANPTPDAADTRASAPTTAAPAPAPFMSDNATIESPPSPSRAPKAAKFMLYAVITALVLFGVALIMDRFM